MWRSSFARGRCAAHGSAVAALPLIGVLCECGGVALPGADVPRKAVLTQRRHSLEGLLSVGPLFVFLDQWNVVADCACLLKRRLLVGGWLSFLFVHLGKCAVCCELLPADPGELVRVNAHFHHLASA